MRFIHRKLLTSTIVGALISVFSAWSFFPYCERTTIKIDSSYTILCSDDYRVRIWTVFFLVHSLGNWNTLVFLALFIIDRIDRWSKNDGNLVNLSKFHDLSKIQQDFHGVWSLCVKCVASRHIFGRDRMQICICQSCWSRVSARCV